MSGTHVLAQHAITSEESPSATEGPPLRSALMGEFLGTALLILLGDGVVAGDVLLNKTSDKMMITTAWGLAVALAVYLCGRLSGGHINPAVTLALAARGEFPRSRVLPYWGAQLAGAFVGALAGLRRLRRGVPGLRAQRARDPRGDGRRQARRHGGRRGRGVRDLPGLRHDPGGTSSANSWARRSCCWASGP